MLSITRTSPDDPTFRNLIAELDADLRSRYGLQQAQFDPHNKIPEDAKVVVALDGETPVGCGCYKTLDDPSRVEIKRMYVRSAWRRSGVAQQILNGLEVWASEEGHGFARLETANKQPEAIALYQKSGYQLIDKYGPYVNMEESVCMEKALQELTNDTAANPKNA